MRSISKLKGFDLRGVFLAFVCVWLVLAAVYPDQLITRSTRFMNVMDTEVPFENTFIIASQLARRHIDLFDPFDGFSFAYAQLTNGLYTLSNILTALGYWLTAPLADDKAKFFHEFYSVAFFTINAFIRTLGGYLLAGLFTRRWWVKTVSLIYLNVIFAQFLMNNGMMINTLIGYLPLLIYAFIRAWQGLSFQDLMRVVLVMTLCVSNAVLCGLAFFYQAVHGLIIAFLASLVLFRRWEIIERLSLCRHLSWWKNHCMAFMIVFICVGLLLLPQVMWAKMLVQDFYIANSGLNGGEGRLSNFFNIDKYFHQAKHSAADPKSFLLGIIDFRFPAWGWSWPFISAGALWLILLGLVFAQGVMPWVLLSAFFWVFCLNFPTDPTKIWGWAHWVNVLTNPWQFLVRSFHMADIVSIFFLWPLLVNGLNGINALWGREKWAVGRMRMAAVVLLIAIGVEAGVSPWPVNGYAVATGGLIVVGCLSSLIKNYWRYIMVGAVALVLFIDLKMASDYVTGDLMKDRFPTIQDYRNPLVFTWQDFYRKDYRPIEPKKYGYLNTYGFYYGFSPLVERFSRASTLYEPRHITYHFLDQDHEGLKYLMRDGRVVFFADAAIDETKKVWGNILESGLDRRVIIVDPSAKDSGRLYEGDQLEIPPANTDSIIERIDRWQGDQWHALIKAPRNGWLVVHWPYDKKWQAIVDKQPQKVYRANRYFLGFPIDQGQHQVELEYMPHHPLRLLVWLMMITTVVLFVYLIRDGLRFCKNG